MSQMHQIGFPASVCPSDIRPFVSWHGRRVAATSTRRDGGDRGGRCYRARLSVRLLDRGDTKGLSLQWLKQSATPDDRQQEVAGSTLTHRTVGYGPGSSARVRVPLTHNLGDLF